MELNSNHICQFWSDQSKECYSVEYCTGVLKVHHSQCRVKSRLGICIPQSLVNLSTAGAEKSHKLNQEVPHSLVRSYLSLNVKNVLDFC